MYVYIIIKNNNFKTSSVTLKGILLPFCWFFFFTEGRDAILNRDVYFLEPLQSSVTIFVEIIDDFVYEDTESFVVRIDAAFGTIELDETTVNILDDDG